MVNLVYEESITNLKDIQSGVATGDKVLSTQTGNVRTGTGITSRRVAQPNGIVGPTGREIGFMHSLGVTTARNWSGPGVNSFVINEDGHAVFSFDLLNQVPTNSDLFGWVNNRDAFVKDYNVGLEKTQVGNVSADCTCQSCEKNFSSSSVKNRLESEASEKSDQNPAHNQRTGGAKLLGVVHAPSLPQLKVHVDPMQAGVWS